MKSKLFGRGILSLECYATAGWANKSSCDHCGMPAKRYPKYYTALVLNDLSRIALSRSCCMACLADELILYFERGTDHVA